jgi:hypothetical protein
VDACGGVRCGIGTGIACCGVRRTTLEVLVSDGAFLTLYSLWLGRQLLDSGTGPPQLETF